MKLSSFKQDESKVKEGIVRKFSETAHIRVARQNNPKFQKMLRVSMDQYKSYRRSNVPEKAIDEATTLAMSYHILLEMVGFTDDAGDITGTAGAVIPDTQENRYKVLSHKDYAEFKDLVSGLSMDFDNFKVEQAEEDLGNLESGSSGNGPGDEKKISSEKLPKSVAKSPTN